MALEGTKYILALFIHLWRLTFFWFYGLSNWWQTRRLANAWLNSLRRASTFESWEDAAVHLDNVLGFDHWRKTIPSHDYDYPLIAERTAQIVSARERGGIHDLINLLRSGFLRNLANITDANLYNHAFAGTKTAIDDYIAEVANAIEHVAAWPTTEAEAATMAPPGSFGRVPIISTQEKLNFSHDARLAFGRTSLMLQGGTMFGLCHLGVVRALFLRGLLPRIITGTETGALIAALVAIHTEEELPEILTENGIDLSAFAGKAIEPPFDRPGFLGTYRGSCDALLRRIDRFWHEGYFLDMKVLEECVHANVGDLTFEEAFQRSKRVLNILLPTPHGLDRPMLLNYLTAPNVLVWTAAVASASSNSALYGDRGTGILCKDAHGGITTWSSSLPSRPTPPNWTPPSLDDPNAPLNRIRQLFNVNHFIISQARPYVLPFLQSDMHGPVLFESHSMVNSAKAYAAGLIAPEIRHRLRQADLLGLVPARLRRFLVDDRVPSPSVTLVPQVTARDFVRLLEVPTRSNLEYWIRKGERSVWPAVAALRIRCVVEAELDRVYQKTRRLKPEDVVLMGGGIKGGR